MATHIPRPKSDMTVEFGVRIFCSIREGKTINPLHSTSLDSSAGSPIVAQIISLR